MGDFRKVPSVLSTTPFLKQVNPWVCFSFWCLDSLGVVQEFIDLCRVPDGYLCVLICLFFLRSFIFSIFNLLSYSMTSLSIKVKVLIIFKLYFYMYG